MRILITGGFGFLGGRLGAYLSAHGHRIILGTRKSKPVPQWLSEAEVMEIRWDDLESMKQLCIGVDVIIHAAAMNAIDCAADPVAAAKFNTLSTKYLARAANLAGVSTFIYLSTIHVYSNPLQGTITEDTRPINLHPYATSKLGGEKSVIESCRNSNINCFILRLSNVYGAPASLYANCWALLINDLCKQCVSEGKITLNSKGNQQRDFIDLSELCNIINQLLLKKSSGVTEQSEIYNVGSGVTKSLVEMATLVQSRCNQILGFKPDLLLNLYQNDENNSFFEFKVEKIQALGIELLRNTGTKELDELLLFCNALQSKNLEH
jgi:UDP-glucose 4-epimerase